MPENDEPLDDLRAVGMNAAAATARVVETVIRDQQQRARDAQEVRSAGGRPTIQAFAEPDGLAPRELPAPEPFPYDGHLNREQAAQPEDYDSQRPARDAEMEAAGVPAEIRNARTVSDLMNGTDPQHAAASGSRTKASPNRGRKAPQRERTRG